MRPIRAALVALLTLAAPPATVPAAGQRQPSPPFRFTTEAGAAIRTLWEESVAAQAERVACLAATVQDGVVHVSRILPLAPDAADSMGISATSSIERCGPPAWAGTIHTHVATYDEKGPSQRFSGQDRTVMRMWYDRWHADAVFCVVYSERDAHCEADGVVGGLRSRPRVVK